MTTSNPCLFCRIARRECPAHIVYEDDYLVAFLDTGPIRPGHVQIIPRDHYPTFDDLTAELASRIIVLGQRLARILKSSHQVNRAAFLFSGGDIAHAHAHVLPMIAPTDITSRRYIAEEKVTFRPIDHDEFGLYQSKLINVIDSHMLARDFCEKPVPTFSHPALARPSEAELGQVAFSLREALKGKDTSP